MVPQLHDGIVCVQETRPQVRPACSCGLHKSSVGHVELINLLFSAMAERSLRPSRFYGKKVVLLTDFPSGSEDELSEEDDDDTDIDETWTPTKKKQGLVIPETDSDESDDCRDLNDDTNVEADKQHTSKPSKTIDKNSKQPERQWTQNKDNLWGNNSPQFLNQETDLVDGLTPADYFKAMFPPDLLDIIVTESNKYASSFNIDLKLTRAELEVFLGINIMMTYIRYPNTRMYWSSNQAIRFNYIADSMGINRYELIRRYLHFNDNEVVAPDNKDKLIKIRPVLNALHDSFARSKIPGEFQSIDEMICPFKGRSSIKQFIKNKPHKWGFKIWVLADMSGYVSCFEVYQGASTHIQSDKNTSLGPVGDMILRITHDIQHHNYKLFMDNFFASLPLIVELQKVQIYALGTIRGNRIPQSKYFLKDAEELKKEGRGAMSYATSNDNITAIRWIDSGPVHVVSNFVGAEPVDTAKRFDKSQNKFIDVKRPAAVAMYNKYMGGVDMADRMIAHYPHTTKNKRWYLRLFFHFLNIAIVNSWIMYRNARDPHTPLVTFKAELAECMIQRGLSEINTKKRGRPTATGTTPPPKRKCATKAGPYVRFDGKDHYPVKVEAKNAPRCHDVNCRSRTRYFCKKCEEPVCPECMENFHFSPEEN